MSAIAWFRQQTQSACKTAIFRSTLPPADGIGGAMNYLRLTVAILLAASAQCSYADSIPTFHITQATMFLANTNGAGDNLGYTFTGPGVTITGLGGMACSDWCGSVPLPANGSPTVSQIFAGIFDIVIIGGKTYDPMTLSLDIFDCCGELNGSFTGSVGGGPDFIEFRMTAPTGAAWTLNFAPTTDLDGNPAFLFTDGEWSARAPLPTPEPATISLTLTGLAGIVGMIRKKRPRPGPE